MGAHLGLLCWLLQSFSGSPAGRVRRMKEAYHVVWNTLSVRTCSSCPWSSHWRTEWTVDLSVYRQENVTASFIRTWCRSRTDWVWFIAQFLCSVLPVSLVYMLLLLLLSLRLPHMHVLRLSLQLIVMIFLSYWMIIPPRYSDHIFSDKHSFYRRNESFFLQG